MKKMNKMYEAPVAEVIKMQMPVVVMSPGAGTQPVNPGTGGDEGE